MQVTSHQKPHGLTFIATVIFGLCQILLLSLDKDILVAASVAMANSYISIISTVFATSPYFNISAHRRLTALQSGRPLSPSRRPARLPRETVERSLTTWNPSYFAAVLRLPKHILVKKSRL